MESPDPTESTPPPAGAAGLPAGARSGAWLALAVPVLLLATGVALLGLAVGQLPYLSSTGAPGPGFLPAWVGGALAVVALVDLVTTARRALHAGPSPAVEPSEHPPARLRELLPVRVLLLVAMIAGAIVAMPYAGAPLVLAGLVFALMRWVQRESLVRSAIAGVATAAAIVAVFDLALGIPLPYGLFEG